MRIKSLQKFSFFQKEQTDYIVYTIILSYYSVWHTADGSMHNMLNGSQTPSGAPLSMSECLMNLNITQSFTPSEIFINQMKSDILM